MFRAVKEIRPRYVVAENVPGLVNWSEGLVFEQVISDLENEGYEVQTVILPAISVDAPHRRDRIWIVAYNSNSHTDRTQRNMESKIDKGFGQYEEKEVFQRENNQCNRFSEISRDKEDITNTKSSSSERKLQQGQRKRKSGGCDSTNVAHTSSIRQPGKEHGKTEPGFISKKNLPNGFQNFPTQSPICSGNDGIPSRLVDITFPKWRNESIKGFGNAIVPQVALQIFNVINELENEKV